MEERCRNIRTDSEVSTSDYITHRLPARILSFGYVCISNIAVYVPATEFRSVRDLDGSQNSAYLDSGLFTAR